MDKFDEIFRMQDALNRRIGVSLPPPSEEEKAKWILNYTRAMQQLSLSFGVAMASLVTAYFIPDRFHASAGEMISGIHRALVVVGVLTLFSALVFRQLRPEDGANVSRHRVEE